MRLAVKEGVEGRKNLGRGEGGLQYKGVVGFHPVFLFYERCDDL